MATANPNIVRLVDCTGQPELCKNLVKELSGCTDIGRSVNWQVDNKYYTAILTILMHEDGVKDSHQLEQAEAIIFLCVLANPDHLERVKKVWQNLECTDPPAVCLLVGITANEESTDPHTLQWCLENGFELVVWRLKSSNSSLSEEDDNDVLDNSEDDESIPRISQALQAHMWPNMTMKGQAKANSSSDTDLTNKVPNPLLPSLTDDLLPKELLSNKDLGDPGDESFEELFERFADMKAHAESLPHEERKAYAEKVVMSFWKAIGGDEEEINLDSSNEED